MPWLDIDGDTFRYCVSGRGKEWLVLVHEMGGSIESWDPLIDKFDQQYRVLRFDMRGAGLSVKLRKPCSFEEHALDLSRLLKVLDIDVPVRMVSYAVGAGVCLQFAMQHSDLVKEMVLMSPAINCTPDSAGRMREWAALIENDGLKVIADDLMKVVYPDEYRLTNPINYVNFRGRWLGNDPTSLGYYFRMLADSDLFPSLGKVTVDALLVTGLKDALRPAVYVQSIVEALPNGHHAVLDAAHHAPDQAPEATWRVISEFFNRHECHAVANHIKKE